MDLAPGRNPYHCFPLVVANGHGWELLCPCAFEATWTGESSPNAIAITTGDVHSDLSVYSHFGGGVLTFDPGCILRTEAPYQMYVTGPINSPKDGLTPLTAIVDTTWLPFTFTMNWIFSRPGASVHFEREEPFCHFFPLSVEAIEAATPVWRNVSADPLLARRFREWQLWRHLSNGDLALDGLRGAFPKHQHFYRRGILPNGENIAEPRRRPNVREFDSSAVDELPQSQGEITHFADGNGHGDLSPDSTSVPSLSNPAAQADIGGCPRGTGYQNDRRR